MAIEFKKVRSFSVRRRAEAEAAGAKAVEEVKSHRSPLSDEYRRTWKPGKMLETRAAKEARAKARRLSRKAEVLSQKRT